MAWSVGDLLDCPDDIGHSVIWKLSANRPAEAVCVAPIVAAICVDDQTIELQRKFSDRRLTQIENFRDFLSQNAHV
jgi:hypothetical protein